jgi:hypothetical protein
MENEKMCDTCTHTSLGRCFKPMNDGTGNVVMEHYVDVYNSDGTCDYYNKKTFDLKVKEAFNRKVYSIRMFLLDIKVLFKYNLYGRFKHGFNLTDLWNLDMAVTKFIYPRLKRFVSEGTQGYPGCLQDKKIIKIRKLSKYVDKEALVTWDNILKAMLLGFKHLNENEDIVDDKTQAEIEEGLRLFSLFYQNLWD